MMTRRFWWAGVAGGVAMFIWASIAHMTPALSTAGIQRMENEPMVLAQLHTNLQTRKGFYVFPAMRQTDPSQPAAASGLLLYQSPPAKGLEPRQLIGELALELIETLVATFLLSMSAITGFGRRVGFFVGIGVLAAVTTNGSYWLWYGFPAAYSLTAMLIEVIKFLVAGLAVGAVLSLGGEQQAGPEVRTRPRSSDPSAAT